MVKVFQEVFCSNCLGLTCTIVPYFLNQLDYVGLLPYN